MLTCIEDKQTTYHYRNLGLGNDQSPISHFAGVSQCAISIVVFNGTAIRNAGLGPKLKSRRERTLRYAGFRETYTCVRRVSNHSKDGSFPTHNSMDDASKSSASGADIPTLSTPDRESPSAAFLEYGKQITEAYRAAKTASEQQESRKRNKQYNEYVDKVEAWVGTVSSQIDFYRKELDQAKTSVAKAKTEIEELTAKQVLHDAEVEHADQKLAESEEARERGRTQYEALERRLEDLIKSLAVKSAVNARLVGEKAAVSERHEHAQARLKMVNTRTLDLEIRLEARRADLAEAKEELEELRPKAKHLESRVQQYDVMASTLATIRSASFMALATPTMRTSKSDHSGMHADNTIKPIQHNGGANQRPQTGKRSSSFSNDGERSEKKLRYS
ncbi:hypothetical protein LTR56_011960 [Elasticomyces elasticus]|nr:hypothetical protein LTR56_011960 [Elasticomyces elasticus]KAK3654772.1 hypothetical protein LTR22_010538 [Elasticomyces elasticus]KAK4920584.1 hypothetical protein LTR49_011831 [Elasticomyces elasticus]KAK5759388.1 hypothetical protein LTS12_010553 [Elasticomyces elasticus]